jgi:hypothetical protein
VTNRTGLILRDTHREIIGSAHLESGEIGPEALKPKCNLRSLDEDGLCVGELADAQCRKFAALT